LLSIAANDPLPLCGFNLSLGLGELTMTLRIETTMNNPGRPDKRFLVAAMLFGIVATAVGIHWLSAGEILIRNGPSHARSIPVQSATEPVAGRIQKADLLYYPVCVTWTAVGTSAITFSLLAFFTARVFYAKLAAYSFAALLPLAFATVAAAIWLGS